MQKSNGVCVSFSELWHKKFDRGTFGVCHETECFFSRRNMKDLWKQMGLGFCPHKWRFFPDKNAYWCIILAENLGQNDANHLTSLPLKKGGGHV